MSTRAWFKAYIFVSAELDKSLVLYIVQINCYSWLIDGALLHEIHQEVGIIIQIFRWSETQKARVRA